jgi:hypothetical protein
MGTLKNNVTPVFMQFIQVVKRKQDDRNNQNAQLFLPLIFDISDKSLWYTVLLSNC